VIACLNLVITIIASIVSGILLWASFPPLGLSLLTWIALIPLFIVLIGKSARYGFVLSLLTGIVFFLGIFNWILDVPGYTLLHHAILALYLGSYVGVFGLMFCFIFRHVGISSACFAAPFLWVSLEFIRSNLFFMALPWGLLAHSQYQNLLFIQIASTVGTYGISFLIVMVNSAISAMVYQLLRRLRKEKGEDLGSIKLTVVTTAALVMFSLIYGYIKTSKPITGEEVKISVLQGNIDQNKKWDRKYAKFIMGTYANLTKEASKDMPALIVWPETATPWAINRDPRLYKEVRSIAQSARTYLLLGSAQQQKFRVKDGKSIKYVNSAFLISPEDKKAGNQRYDKIRLFPFGEYLPYKETIPWSYLQVPDVGSYVPGQKFSVFDFPGGRFGVTICWENIFPDLFRRFVKAGALFMINITNEAWFGKTAAPEQFVAMSVLRAVENQVYVVRCANTGVSCFIDPYGRVVDRVRNSTGNCIFVRGVLTAPVIPLESGTFYTRHGDWLAWLCFPCSMVFLFIAFFKRKHSSLPLSR
jgi:apolipoprotein N-acyltransferase